MPTAAEYRGAHVWQGGTAPCPWQNCDPTTHVTLTDADSLGVKPATAARVGQLRNWIDSHYGLGCVGTSLIQCETGTVALWGAKFTHKWDIDPHTIRSFLLGGYKVAGIEQYWPWHGTPYDYSPAFNGGHAIAYQAAHYNSAISTPRWEWWRDDPLRKLGGQWVPEALAIKALAATFSDSNAEFSITRCFAASAAKKTLYPGGAIRALAKVGSVRRGDLQLGSMLSHAGTVAGGSWTVNGKTGTTWLKVTAIDGVPTTKLYGATVAAVYIALGWVTGPTGAY